MDAQLASSFLPFYSICGTTNIQVDLFALVKAHWKLLTETLRYILFCSRVADSQAQP